MTLIDFSNEYEEVNFFIQHIDENEKIKFDIYSLTSSMCSKTNLDILQMCL